MAPDRALEVERRAGHTRCSPAALLWCEPPHRSAHSPSAVVRRAHAAAALRYHPPMSQRLGRYPVSISIPVGWGDVDAFQHVNNVAYARWQEAARVAYLMRLGMMEWAKTDGVAPILGHLSIDYRRPVKFPDTVRLDATVSRIGTSSFHMAYRFWSEAQADQVATGQDVIVVVDSRTGKSTPLASSLRAAIHALEETGHPAPSVELVAT